MAKRRSAGTPALVALEHAGVAHNVLPYEHDPTSDLSYGQEAARALGVDPDRVFKTLVVSADGALGVAVVPVTRELDLKAMARALRAKRVGMADPSTAERSTGYVVGGISPLGQRQQLATVVDSSAYEAEVMYVSGGRRGLDIGLAPSDLVALTSASTAPIARTRTQP